MEKHALLEGKSLNLKLYFRILNNSFSQNSISTWGISESDIYYKLLDGTVVDIQIFDTAGQERYRSINKSYYSRVDACILVYDITNRKSFEECNDFNSIIKEMCKKDIKLMLLGNKIDLENESNITKEEASEFANLHGYIFYEISCKDNINVLSAFEKLIEVINFKELEYADKHIINLNKNKSQKKKCC